MQLFIRKCFLDLVWKLLITSNEETNDIMRISKSLEESGLLIKDVSETIKNKAQEQNGGFPSMLLGILGTSLLGNINR